MQNIMQKFAILTLAFCSIPGRSLDVNEEIIKLPTRKPSNTTMPNNHGCCSDSSSCESVVDTCANEPSCSYDKNIVVKDEYSIPHDCENLVQSNEKHTKNHFHVESSSDDIKDFCISDRVEYFNSKSLPDNSLNPVLNDNTIIGATEPPKVVIKRREFKTRHKNSNENTNLSSSEENSQNIVENLYEIPRSSNNNLISNSYSEIKKDGNGHNIPGSPKVVIKKTVITTEYKTVNNKDRNFSHQNDNEVLEYSSDSLNDKSYSNAQDYFVNDDTTEFKHYEKFNNINDSFDEAICYQNIRKSVRSIKRNNGFNCKSINANVASNEESNINNSEFIRNNSIRSNSTYNKNLSIKSNSTARKINNSHDAVGNLYSVDLCNSLLSTNSHNDSLCSHYNKKILIDEFVQKYLINPHLNDQIFENLDLENFENDLKELINENTSNSIFNSNNISGICSDFCIVIDGLKSFISYVKWKYINNILVIKDYNEYIGKIKLIREKCFISNKQLYNFIKEYMPQAPYQKFDKVCLLNHLVMCSSDFINCPSINQKFKERIDIECNNILLSQNDISNNYIRAVTLFKLRSLDNINASMLCKMFTITILTTENCSDIALSVKYLIERFLYAKVGFMPDQIKMLLELYLQKVPKYSTENLLEFILFLVSNKCTGLHIDNISKPINILNETNISADIKTSNTSKNTKSIVAKTASITPAFNTGLDNKQQIKAKIDMIIIILSNYIKNKFTLKSNNIEQTTYLENKKIIIEIKEALVNSSHHLGKSNISAVITSHIKKYTQKCKFSPLALLLASGNENCLLYFIKYFFSENYFKMYANKYCLIDCLSIAVFGLTNKSFGNNLQLFEILLKLLNAEEMRVHSTSTARKYRYLLDYVNRQIKYGADLFSFEFNRLYSFPYALDYIIKNTPSDIYAKLSIENKKKLLLEMIDKNLILQALAFARRIDNVNNQYIVDLLISKNMAIIPYIDNVKENACNMEAYLSLALFKAYPNSFIYILNKCILTKNSEVIDLQIAHILQNMDINGCLDSIFLHLYDKNKISVDNMDSFFNMRFAYNRALTQTILPNQPHN